MAGTPLKLKTELAIGPYITLLEQEVLVRDEAKKVAATCARNGRNDEAIFANVHRGLVLQYAVAMVLVDLGYNVQVASDADMHYDLIVDDVKVDVKGRWNGRYWQQTAWEAEVVPLRGNDVLYLCIDIMPNGQYIHQGQCWSADLKSSIWDQPYVGTFSEVL